jgi:hypothetical protein
MPNITENPDYRLVMTFLQNIRPGDMDQESADQLLMIGERMKAGGSLSDREREMFEAVVGAMPQMPETEMSYEVDGRMENMSPQMMDSMVSSGQISRGIDRMKPEDEDPDSRLIRMIRSGEISASEIELAMDSAMPSNLSPEEMDRFMAQKNAAINQMPSQDGETYGPSSGVTVAPSNVMNMDDAIAAGLVNPTRPQARPAPMRPQARPMR